MRSAKSSLADRVGAAGQPPHGSDDGACQCHATATAIPSATSVISSTARRAAAASSRAPATACRASSKCRSRIAGRQRDRATQNGVGLLVILHQRFPFGRDGDHAVRGLSIRAAVPS